MRPCPLYTPPVAPTDESSGEVHGVAVHAMAVEVKWTSRFRGRRSRNKVSVGEPAEGSFKHLSIFHL